MRESKLGKKLTKEHCANVSVALKGKKKPLRTAEHIRKIVLARPNVPNSPENRIKISKRMRLVKSRSNSGFKGVWHNKATNVFTAQITVDKKKTSIGTFPTARDAAKAYNVIARSYGWPEEGLNQL